MTLALVGRGSSVQIALIQSGQRVIPPTTVFTTGSAAASGATSISVTFTPEISVPLIAPLWLNFIDPSGKSYLAQVTGNVATNATTLTVEDLHAGIPAGSTASYPPILGTRESANLTDADKDADIMVFENAGWQDSLTTMLGNGLDLNGFYSPEDAGWNTALYARLNFLEVFFQISLPVPPGYTTGQIIQGFGAVKMPLEVPADGIIKANISLKSRGPLTFVAPS